MATPAVDDPLRSSAGLTALALVLIGLALPLHLGLLPYAFDDAYIHFRVAGHLVDHGAPYFNPGEAVMTSSSPLWTLWLAFLFGLFPREIWLVAALNAVFSAAGAIVWARLGRTLGGPRFGAPACWGVALAYLGVVHYAGAGLMESPLALLCLGTGLLLYTHGRPSAFLWLALAVFLRLELATFLALTVAHGLLRRSVAPTRLARWTLGGALGPLLYQLYFFGTLVPHTALAKSTVYALSPVDALRNLVNFSLPDVPGLPLVWTRRLWLPLLAAIFLGALGVVARLRREERETSERLALLLVAALAVPATYVVSAGLVFPWYVPLFLAPLTVGLAACAARASRSAVRAAALVALLSPPVAGLVDSAFAALVDPAGYRYFSTNARVRKYLELGERLEARYGETRLLSSEVGGLGYAFGGEILDGAGLISPAALAHHPMAVPEQRSLGFLGAIPAEFVRMTRPELIVTLDVFAEELLQSDVMADYRLLREPIYVEDDLKRVSAPVLWGSRHMNVLVRRDVAARSGEAGDAPRSRVP